MTTTIPLAPIKRILKNTNLRVSDDAVLELEQILTSFATEIAGEAAKITKHAGRKTIKSEDIKLVV